ncbi:hypothetical protein QFC22_002784 [Naganishia vaughanmartiniae]|uniref:Uncharacterized protein n=1 Tax=Naganishia vaughanmartiniae TaxID=1424756 RepID=A0ACC2X9Z6_9TREE|nr:hypothetical protein QFC22_002784 [Naganishia vaughanmartiniae]
MPASSKPIALVTGASSGIGRTSSVALIKAGWRVVLSGRRKEELEATAEMGRKALREDGKEDEAKDDQLVLVAVGDVSQESNVKEMFEQIQKVYGRLDLLFNNAGISGKAIPVEDLDIQDYLSVMAINVTAAVICTQYATRIMKEQTPQGGRIINNGSKHAISGLTKSTSLDGRKYNIAASQLDIGNAATAMGGGAANGVPQADGTNKPEATFDVEEVGRAIVYMASLPLGANVFNMTLMYVQDSDVVCLKLV